MTWSPKRTWKRSAASAALLALAAWGGFASAEKLNVDTERRPFFVIARVQHVRTVTFVTLQPIFPVHLVTSIVDSTEVPAEHTTISCEQKRIVHEAAADGKGSVNLRFECDHGLVLEYDGIVFPPK